MPWAGEGPRAPELFGGPESNSGAALARPGAGEKNSKGANIVMRDEARPAMATRATPAMATRGVSKQRNEINKQKQQITSSFSKSEKWSRNGSPGHGFETRPLKSQPYCAESPFRATPRPGQARTIRKHVRQNCNPPPSGQTSLLAPPVRAPGIYTTTALEPYEFIGFGGGGAQNPCVHRDFEHHHKRTP